jgi:hypothetical protein
VDTTAAMRTSVGDLDVMVTSFVRALRAANKAPRTIPQRASPEPYVLRCPRTDLARFAVCNAGPRECISRLTDRALVGWMSADFSGRGP